MLKASLHWSQAGWRPLGLHWAELQWCLRLCLGATGSAQASKQNAEDWAKVQSFRKINVLSGFGAQDLFFPISLLSFQWLWLVIDGKFCLAATKALCADSYPSAPYCANSSQKPRHDGHFALQDSLKLEICFGEAIESLKKHPLNPLRFYMCQPQCRVPAKSFKVLASLESSCGVWYDCHLVGGHGTCSSSVLALICGALVTKTSILGCMDTCWIHVGYMMDTSYINVQIYSICDWHDSRTFPTFRHWIRWSIRCLVCDSYCWPGSSRKKCIKKEVGWHLLVL